MIPKVTIYITACNYAEYLDQAIESVLSQTSQDYELIIIDDGSTDDTGKVASKYKSDTVRIITNTTRQGLPKSANIALGLAKGKYFVRLDGDDYLEPHAIEILSNYLDRNEDVSLVYPDYYELYPDGRVSIVQRKNAKKESQLMDLPAHGACTMIRTQSLRDVNGYSENIDCQDGYDIWLKFLNRFKVDNINLPLFYYRRHGNSLSDNSKNILKTRRFIKEEYIKNNNIIIPDTIAIVPIRGDSFKYLFETDISICVDGEKEGLLPIIGHIIIEIKKSKYLKDVIITSEDGRVLSWASRNNIKAIERPIAYSKRNVPIDLTVNHVKQYLEAKSSPPYSLMLLHSNSPLRKSFHIDEAIATQAIYKCDSVISIVQETSNLYQHKKSGLESIYYDKKMRLERNEIYKENGSILLTKRSCIEKDELLGNSVSHIVMEKEYSLQFDTEFEFDLVKEALRLQYNV